MNLLFIVDDTGPTENNIYPLLAHHNVLTQSIQQLASSRTISPDVIFIDIDTDIDRKELIRTITNKYPDTSIIFMAEENQIQDISYFLDHGAIDYLIKPLEIKEVDIRLKVIEQRNLQSKKTCICIGDICFDRKDNTVTKNNIILDISRRELSILQCLMENPGRIQTRCVLEKNLYKWDQNITSNSIEVHVHNLRKKLGKDFIKTVRAVGYKTQMVENSDNTINENINSNQDSTILI